MVEYKVIYIDKSGKCLWNSMLMIHSELMSLKCSHYIWLVSLFNLAEDISPMFHFVNNICALLLAKSMCKNNNIVFLFCTTTALLFILASAGSCFFSTLGLFRALLGHCGSYIGSVHVCSRPWDPYSGSGGEYHVNHNQ